MKPFLSYGRYKDEFGWEFASRVTNFGYIDSVVKHFKRRKHWSTVSTNGWVRLAPEMLMLWEE